MPGGGPAYGKPLTEMGPTELFVEMGLRLAATTIIALLFGALVAKPEIDAGQRIFVATIGVPLFALFALHTATCFREVWRRYHD
jgi:hypothetical protein